MKNYKEIKGSPTFYFLFSTFLFFFVRFPSFLLQSIAIPPHYYQIINHTPDFLLWVHPQWNFATAHVTGESWSLTPASQGRASQERQRNDFPAPHSTPDEPEV